MGRSIGMTVSALARDTDTIPATAMRPVVIASSIGTIIEWYDFLVYATSAALVFNKLFFPAIAANGGTLAALATYAVGFFARPFGGALFGHFGDRLGRKSMLMITLLIMGGATFAIGLLPTYATIGIWAPILLVTLRVIQGIGLGGEWGGAALIVLEHAPASRRGFYGSLVQIGFPVGLVLATFAVAMVAKLSEADLLAWGWRIPFLLSSVLFALGAFVRWRVAETPVFVAMEARRALAANPVLEVVAKSWGNFFIAIGLKLSEVSWVYLLTVFITVYVTTTLKMPKTLVLNGVVYAALFELVSIPLFGWLSDHIGRRALFILGALFSIAFAFPLFWMLDTKAPLLITLAIIIAMNFGHGMMFGVEATYLPELFKGPVRYSGASFGFQIAAAVGGGLSPVIATALVGYTGGTAGVSIMLIGLAVITLVAALWARETLGEPL
jgi:MHS family shikimate/dehydroshikimate transporter-like MFS transporter